MRQRNMLYTCPMIDLEVDQQGQAQAHLHPEPCVLYRSITSFPQPNIHTILPAPTSRTTFDVNHLSDHHGALSYGMNQYNGIHHHHHHQHQHHHHMAGNLEYNMYMNPSSGNRVFPIPSSHGPHDQLTSNNRGIVEASVNSHFMDGVGGAFKIKNAEGISGNFQFSYASAGSSSSVGPMNARPLESDAACFALPEYRGNDISSIMEVGPHRNARNILGVDTVLAQNPNHFVQGNHLAQPFQMAGTPWSNQQFSNGGDAGTLSWNHAPALPYLHGSINAGSMESTNMCMPGYQVTANNRSSTTFLHPPPMPQGHPNLHHIPPPIQGARGHNVDFHSQAATSSRRLSTNSTSHTSMGPFQDGVELGPRFVGPAPPAGLRIYRPHRRDTMLDATPRQRSLPHLRVLPEDGVAILELSGYHEVRDSIDNHRDMRLDIDNMSYEELLALGEQIGSVGTGLSEEFIISQLKKRTFVSSTSDLKETEFMDQEPNFCVVCQADYKDEEKIGILKCGHEYHIDCIKKWLLVKNTCPICKSSALSTQTNDL